MLRKRYIRILLMLSPLLLVALLILGGLRVELDGTGRFPIFSFHKAEDHYTALARDRAEQKSEPAAEPSGDSASSAVPAGGSSAPEPSGLQPVSAAAHTEAEPAAPAEAASTPASSGSGAAPESRAAGPGDWTDFRGPARDGKHSQIKIRTDWPAAGLKPLWKQPIGGGYASFVAAQGRAFTIEQRRNREVVAAYDIATGRELWTHGWEAEFQERMGGDGPRATPTWHDGRLYALGATGQMACLEAQSGRVIWSRDILQENRARNLSWGMSASPLVVDDKVIVLPGGSRGNSVVAYHRISGEKIWSVLDDQQAYTAPLVVQLAGKRQLLVVSAERAMGLEVADGRLLWDYRWVTQYGINSAEPLLVGSNRFFLSAGYGHGAALVEVSGDAASGFQARTVWENLNMKNKFNAAVLHEGFIYGLDEGILACVEAATGERRWKGGRYGYGQVLLADGHLIVLTERGELVLVPATPEGHREIASFQALSGKTWNHPALAGPHLLVRNTTEMACYLIGAGE